MCSIDFENQLNSYMLMKFINQGYHKHKYKLLYWHTNRFDIAIRDKVNKSGFRTTNTYFQPFYFK